MRTMSCALAAAALILGPAGGAIASAKPKKPPPPDRVPVVAAGMEWGVDPDSCQLMTSVEGRSMYKTLTLTSAGIGNSSSNYELMMDAAQMRVPKQVTLLANGSEPLVMPVSVPSYGPAGAIWFSPEDGSVPLSERLDAKETVMLFTVFEMISLSPFGYEKAKETRQACLKAMFASVGIDMVEFAGEGDALRVAAAPQGDVRGVFSYTDYPMEALAKGEQGMVRATLVIDESGRPKKCLVFKSSGSTRLDDTTCDVVLARAKFSPAKDNEGRAVPSLYVMPPVRWEFSR